ncbi:MAG: response regulator transcription factor [Eubacteriaceae bacterium]|nr:response regulator transcription factor [Eubacteriaceae bacterium]
MYKILIADDEEKIRAIIKKYAEFEGHKVTEAKDGMEAVLICRNEEFDIIILDIMMPELDGFSACREIRKMTDTPVLMLSARGEEYDKIHGFELGVDDYVVKPFSPKELMLRIDAIIRRSSSKEDEAGTYSYDNLHINFKARVVHIDNAQVNLSPKEYELLFYMVKNRGIALSREMIINNVWGYDYYGDERTLDTHIKLLRKNLGDYAKLITTLRGMGYRFEAE